MARNYSKKSSARPQRKNQPRRSSFSVFIVGVFVGVIGSHLLPALLEKKSSFVALENRSEQQNNKSDPDFQFPNLLKGAEIKIPGTNPPSEDDKGAVYLLQVGSFKNNQDAESLRVQLLLLNLESFIESYKTSSGDMWHRVLVGPFTSNNDSLSARAKLSENNLDSLLLKRDPS
jgi:cell division protein FtsN